MEATGCSGSDPLGGDSLARDGVDFDEQVDALADLGRDTPEASRGSCACIGSCAVTLMMAWRRQRENAIAQSNCPVPTTTPWITAIRLAAPLCDPEARPLTRRSSATKSMPASSAGGDDRLPRGRHRGARARPRGAAAERTGTSRRDRVPLRCVAWLIDAVLYGAPSMSPLVPIG
jgi:hypothetical protein